MAPAKPVAPKIRPFSTMFEITQPDESGHVVSYRVQVDARRVWCGTDTQEGGSLTIPELFSFCCAAQARRSEGK